MAKHLESVIITIPKKGDLSNCSNWRGTTLLNSIEKVLALIIVDSISPAVNKILRDEQNGFRPQRSFVNHINTVRITIEYFVEWQSPLYLLDFDTVKRSAIWSSLKSCGVPDKIIDLM